MSKTVFNTERLLAGSAILISLLTLVTLIYQISMERRQSRLSVRPRVEFTDYESLEGSSIRRSLVIENRGLGPAIFESGYIVYEGSNYKLDFEAFFWEEQLLDSLVSLNKNTSLSQGSSILPGKSITLYEVTFPLSHLNQVLKNRRLIDEEGEPKFQVIFTYSSLYEERWEQRSDVNGHPVRL